MFSQEAEELLPPIPSCSTMSTTRTARRRKYMRQLRGPWWIPPCKDTTLLSSHMDKLELGKRSPCTIRIVYRLDLCFSVLSILIYLRISRVPFASLKYTYI